MVKKKKGFLFLTYQKFEHWISAHFDEKNLEKIFGVQGQSDLKSLFAQKYDLYQEIQKHGGGKIENAIAYFSKKPLYLNLDFQIKKEYLQTEQSGLYLLDDAFKKIN